MTILTAIQKIELAKDIFIISLKVDEAVRDELWDADDLKPHMMFKGETDKLYRPLHHRKVSQESLKSWANAQVYYSLVMLSIETNDALEKKFGKDRLNDSDAELGAARSIMFLVRTMDAHSPIRPVWNIQNPKYLKVFEIPSLGLSLDGPAIQGKPVKASHYGGWNGFLDLVDYCVKSLTSSK